MHRDRTKLGLMIWGAEITQQGLSSNVWFHARYSTDGGKSLDVLKQESAMVRHIN